MLRLEFSQEEFAQLHLLMHQAMTELQIPSRANRVFHGETTAH
jgi:hypothetical protein